MFSADLSSLLFSTYLGGRDWDLGLATAVSAGGVFYLAGETKSPDLPALDATDPKLSGAKNGVLVQFRPVGLD